MYLLEVSGKKKTVKNISTPKVIASNQNDHRQVSETMTLPLITGAMLTDTRTAKFQTPTRRPRS